MRAPNDDVRPDKPIFIGGIRRSGTSLMRAIVGSHPTVALLEYDVKLWANYHMRYKTANFRDAAMRDKIIADVLSNKKLAKMAYPLDTEAIWEQVRAQQIDNLAEFFQLLMMTYAAARQRPRWGMKTPGNEFFADDIFAAYQQPKMVHMLRHLSDVAVSIKSRKMPFNLIADGFWWSESIRLARTNKQKYGDDYIVVHYEELTSDPARIVQEVCDTLELDFQPEMLEASGFPRDPSNNTSLGLDAPSRGGIIKQRTSSRDQTDLPPVELRFYQSITEEVAYTQAEQQTRQALNAEQTMLLLWWRGLYRAFALRYFVFKPLDVFSFGARNWTFRKRLHHLLKVLKLYRPLYAVRQRLRHNQYADHPS